jgi:hypothetical protein
VERTTEPGASSGRSSEESLSRLQVLGFVASLTLLRLRRCFSVLDAAFPRGVSVGNVGSPKRMLGFVSMSRIGAGELLIVTVVVVVVLLAVDNTLKTCVASSTQQKWTIAATP